MRLESIKSEELRKKQSRERQVPVLRVMAQVKLLEGLVSNPTIIPVRVVLNDFRPDSLKFFSPVNLMPGQEISLAIEEPVACYVRGAVAWSYPVNRDVHVFSQSPCNYRIKINLAFDTPEERQTIEKYCRYLFAQILRPKPMRSWIPGVPALPSKRKQR